MDTDTDEKKTSGGGTNGWDVLREVIKAARDFGRDWKWPLMVVGLLASLQQGWLDIPIMDAAFKWVIEGMKAAANLIPGVG